MDKNTEKTCVTCGKAFKPNYLHRNHCSAECTAANNVRRQRAYRDEDPEFHRRYIGVYHYLRYNTPSSIDEISKKGRIMAELIRGAMEENPDGDNKTIAMMVLEAIGSIGTSENRETASRESWRNARTMSWIFDEMFPELDEVGFNSPKTWFSSAIVEGFISNRDGQTGRCKKFRRTFRPTDFPVWSGGRTLPTFEVRVNRRKIKVLSCGRTVESWLPGPYKMPQAS